MMTTTPTTNHACIQNHTTLKRSAGRMSNVAVVVPMENPYRHCRKKQATAAATMTAITSTSMTVSQDEEPKDSTIGVVDYDKDEFGALWLPDDIVCQLLAQAERAYDTRIQRQQQQAAVSVSVSSQPPVAKAGLQQPQPLTTKNHLRFSHVCLTPEPLSTRSSPSQPPLEILWSATTTPMCSNPPPSAPSKVQRPSPSPQHLGITMPLPKPSSFSVPSHQTQTQRTSQPMPVPTFQTLVSSTPTPIEQSPISRPYTLSSCKQTEPWRTGQPIGKHQAPTLPVPTVQKPATSFPTPIRPSPTAVPRLQSHSISSSSPLSPLPQAELSQKIEALGRGLLTQMVDNDAGDAMDCDRTRMAELMTRMRTNLENYVNKALSNIGRLPPVTTKKNSLYHNIQTLQSLRQLPSIEFVAAMHQIRIYGNCAAHGMYEDLPTREECERVVQHYTTLKEQHQMQQQTQLQRN